MKKEDLFHEIGEIDEDLVEEAAEIEPANYSGGGNMSDDGSAADKSGSKNILRIGLSKYRDVIGMAAACFVLVYILGHSSLFGGGSSEDAGRQETTAASAETTAAAAETTAAAALEQEVLEGAVPGEGVSETTAAEETRAETGVETITTAAAENETTAGCAPELPWDEKEIWQKYPEFGLYDIMYCLSNYMLPEEQLGDALDSITIGGYDYDKDVGYEITAQVYEIKDIDLECALAIQYEGDDGYYIAINYQHCPAKWAQSYPVN